MEKLQEELEGLEKWRTKWLFINLIGFCLWDGMRIAINYFLEASKNPILVAVMGLGWLLWILGLVQLLRFGAKARKTKQALQILNDELVTSNRLKAWRTGFLALSFTQVVIIVVTTLGMEVQGILAAEVSIFVAVTSAIGSFLYFNTEQNGGV